MLWAEGGAKKGCTCVCVFFSVAVALRFLLLRQLVENKKSITVFFRGGGSGGGNAETFSTAQKKFGFSALFSHRGF